MSGFRTARVAALCAVAVLGMTGCGQDESPSLPTGMTLPAVSARSVQAPVPAASPPSSMPEPAEEAPSAPASSDPAAAPGAPARSASAAQSPPGSAAPAGSTLHRASPSSAGAPLDVTAAVPDCLAEGQTRPFADTQFQADLGEGWTYEVCNNLALGLGMLSIATIQPDGALGRLTFDAPLQTNPGAGIACARTASVPTTCLIQSLEAPKVWRGTLLQLQSDRWIELPLPGDYRSNVPMALYSSGAPAGVHTDFLLLAQGTSWEVLALDPASPPQGYTVTGVLNGNADQLVGCTEARTTVLPPLPTELPAGGCLVNEIKVVEG